MLAEPQGTAELLVHLDRNEFYEGEPIYAVLELRNSGRDTVRVPPFDLAADWLRGTLRRDSVEVPGGLGIIVDYAFGLDYRGTSLPGGQSRFMDLPLQSYWGGMGPLDHSLYLRRLVPGTYVMRWTVLPLRRGRRAVTPLIESRSVSFVIRRRTSAEDTVVDAFERLGPRLDILTWQAADFDSVLAWSAQRLAVDSADPFVPVLLASSLTKAGVSQRGADSLRIQRTRDLELAIIEARPALVSTAYLYAEMTMMSDSQQTRLADRLAPTLAGRMARARLDAQRRN